MSISTHKDTLKRLKKYNNSPAPIISIYFHLPKSLSKGELIFSSCSEVINQDLSTNEKKLAEKNLEYISGFLQNYKKKGNEQSIAIFSGGDSFFEIIHLPYKIKNAAYFSHSPILQPLLEEESVYRHYLVVLIDRQKARFFTMTQGIVEKSGEIYDPSVPQNIHQNAREDMHNNREQKINRHIEDHLSRHLEKLAHGIEDFIGTDTITGIIIGGHKNLFQKFEHHLSRFLQEKVVGQFVTELNVNKNVLVSRSKKLITEIDERLNHEEYPFITHH